MRHVDRLWPHRSSVLVAISAAVSLHAGLISHAGDVKPCAAAAWEFRLLGVDDAAKLQEMRDRPQQRRVKLGVVGSGGVSEHRLKSFLNHGHTFTYHGCADSKKPTHDTAMVKSILDKLTVLGVQIDVHLWQWEKETVDCPGAFSAAGQACDVVCFYQSFWGKESPMIAKAIRESSHALFISPYVGYKNLPSGQSPQGHAHKPWAPESIGHFVTVVPLARRRSKGRIAKTLNRNAADFQAINFIAPSYHASGPGGTCYGCEVGTACALYLYAIMAHKPTPAEMIDILRATSSLDRKLLTSVDEFDDAAADRLQVQVEPMLNPPEGKLRKLDAPGVLNLYAAFRRATGEK